MTPYDDLKQAAEQADAADQVYIADSTNENKEVAQENAFSNYYPLANPRTILAMLARLEATERVVALGRRWAVTGDIMDHVAFKEMKALIADYDATKEAHDGL